MAARFVLILFFAVVLPGGLRADALSRQQQRREISRASSLARSAAKLARQGKLEVAAAEFEKAQRRIEAVASSDVTASLEKVFNRAVGLLGQVHQQLGEAGVPLRPLELSGGPPGGGRRQPGRFRRQEPGAFGERS